MILPDIPKIENGLFQYILTEFGLRKVLPVGFPSGGIYTSMS